MSAGQLRESVTFQRRAAGSDGMGNSTTGAWAAITGCVALPAELRPVKQTEVTIAEGVQARTTYMVKLRERPELLGLTVGDRMINARAPTQTFNVKSAPTNPDMRGRYLQVIVERGGADG